MPVNVHEQVTFAQKSTLQACQPDIRLAISLLQALEVLSLHAIGKNIPEQYL